MKTCSKCKKEKDLGCFPVRKTAKDGRQSNCRECINEAKKKYREANKEKIREYKLNHYKENQDKILSQKKEYREANKEKIKQYKRQYESKRRKQDPIYNQKFIIGSLIRSAIKNNGYTEKSKLLNILCCEYDVFKNHIESKFTNGMNWSNHGSYGWHIDHITPISKATTKEGVLKLNHYTNLQPLWAKDNIKKSNK